jgi:ribosomal protein L22
MAEEKKVKKVKEQKSEVKDKIETIQEVKEENVKKEQSAEKAEKAEEKKEVKKIENKKRNFVVINGRNLPLSVKAAAHTCSMIKGRNIDLAIKMLEEVSTYRRVVKMNNREIGHRHGEGIMAGRYPINVARELLKLCKSLRADAIYHEMELEKAVLTLCVANKAARPYKRGGARAKRAHIFLRLEIKQKKENK